uniref:Probable serine/threonine-protein kinase dyrk1 n=1 Tax=Dermatophagoides pteronyssinus TaxID=6956 RepID=A0A6P6YA49_DERPT|nr:probable serine/threonine-protein kinase dyrk1 [Dermatophagoides pteronyssinus]
MFTDQFDELYSATSKSNSVTNKSACTMEQTDGTFNSNFLGGTALENHNTNNFCTLNSFSSDTKTAETVDFQQLSFKELKAQIESFTIDVHFSNSCDFKKINNKYLLIDQISVSNSAVIYIAKNISKNTRNSLYCLKIFVSEKSSQMLEELMLSLKVSKLKHVAEVYDYFYYNTQLCIVMPYLGINLYEFINIFNGEVSHELLVEIFRQVVKAILELHKNNIVHCDIKPENILIDVMADKVEVNLIDFGVSYEINQLKQFINSQNHPDKFYIQTRPYRAPELLLMTSINETIDWWSLGCVILEIYAGMRVPQKNINGNFFSHQEHKQIRRPTNLESEYTTGSNKDKDVENKQLVQYNYECYDEYDKLIADIEFTTNSVQVEQDELMNKVVQLCRNINTRDKLNDSKKKISIKLESNNSDEIKTSITNQTFYPNENFEKIFDNFEEMFDSFDDDSMYTDDLEFPVKNQFFKGQENESKLKNFNTFDNYINNFEHTRIITAGTPKVIKVSTYDEIPVQSSIRNFSTKFRNASVEKEYDYFQKANETSSNSNIPSVSLLNQDFTNKKKSSQNLTENNNPILINKLVNHDQFFTTSEDTQLKDLKSSNMTDNNHLVNSLIMQPSSQKEFSHDNESVYIDRRTEIDINTISRIPNAQEENIERDQFSDIRIYIEIY